MAPPQEAVGDTTRRSSRPRRQRLRTLTKTTAAVTAAVTAAAAAAGMIASSPSSSSYSPVPACSAFAFSSASFPPPPVVASAPSSRMAGPRLAVGSTLSSPRSSSSRSDTSLQVSFANFEDLVYAAQSSASGLAASTMSSSGGVPSPSSLALLYAAGLLTSFSPCSLGLLPLTVSYISASAGEREDKAALLPTIAFAAGLASVFCGLGLSASLLGGVFGSSGSGGGGGGGSGGILGAILLASLSSGVSIAMGLQLLDLVRIPLPSFEIGVPSSSFGEGDDDGDMDGTRIDGSGSAEICFDEDGNLLPAATTTTTATPTDTATTASSSSAAIASLFRTFLLGGSSALVASSCATPVLTSILAYVATTRDPILGTALLFTYTIGYSTPLLIIGATGGQALAKAQAAANGDRDGDVDGSVMSKVGGLVTPLTASVLIWYGTTGFLEAVFGDPSLMGLAPVLD